MENQSRIEREKLIKEMQETIKHQESQFEVRMSQLHEQSDMKVRMIREEYEMKYKGMNNGGQSEEIISKYRDELEKSVLKVNYPIRLNQEKR